MKDKFISMRNWADWCEMHTFNLVNADDKKLWEDYIKFAKQILDEVVLCPDGEETHILRIDAEHMYPYFKEGVYDA